MGSLYPNVYEIPEDSLDFILDYFADSPRDGDAQAMIVRFIAEFRREHPARAASKRIDGFAKVVHDHLTYTNGQPILPPGSPAWRDYVAFYAIVACSDREAAIGEILANDTCFESYGNLWGLLETVCSDEDDREAEVALRELMLDRDLGEPLLLAEVQRSSKFLALLRRDAVARLRSAGPLIARFLQAIDASDGPTKTREVFAEDLRKLAKYISATDSPDVCLFCESETT
jgi:hypothetical protein